MKTETTLRKEGRWTSFVTRQTNELKRGLLEQLDRAPTARDKVLIETIGTKFGIVVCLQRTLKSAVIVDEHGQVAPRVSKQLLAWIAGLERSVQALLGEDVSADTLVDLPGIVEKFRSKV